VLVGLRLYLHPGRGPKEAVDPHANGYVETIDGALVLHVKGAPYEDAQGHPCEHDE